MGWDTPWKGAHVLRLTRLMEQRCGPPGWWGVQAEEERLRPGDTLDPRSGVGYVAPGRPQHHLQASLHAPRGRRLTGAICLHYTGLFGEASDGGLSWLREGLIYWQTCFEALFKVAAPQIRARRMAALGTSPCNGGFQSGGAPGVALLGRTGCEPSL